MTNNKIYQYISALLITTLFSCSSENEDVVKPMLSENYPQIILLDEEGGGELEDSDEFSIVLVLADRYDPSGEALGGEIVPLEEDFLLDFQINDLVGLDAISSYVLSCTAFYEIDDCTTSEDEDVVLLQAYDAETGSGQLIFPAGVEEIEVVFTLDPAYVEDDVLNEERAFSVLFSPAVASEEVQLLETPFVYEVLDDEVIFGEWEGALSEEAWTNFQDLFGAINEDITSLEVDDIEEIIWEFGYQELKIEVVLKETEAVEECGETEMENIVIEIEGEYDELTRDALSGDMVVVGDLEQEDGSEEEYVFEGAFTISGNTVVISMLREYQDEASEEITLTLNK